MCTSFFYVSLNWVENGWKYWKIEIDWKAERNKLPSGNEVVSKSNLFWNNQLKSILTSVVTAIHMAYSVDSNGMIRQHFNWQIKKKKKAVAMNEYERLILSKICDSFAHRKLQQTTFLCVCSSVCVCVISFHMIKFTRSEKNLLT